jgi:hypothetical protein
MTLRNSLGLLACTTALMLAVPNAKAEVEASIDLRLVDSNGRNSFMDGGFGKLRYDDADSGLQMARARFAWRDSIGGNWHANVDLSAWSLNDKNPIDVTEAWLEWRPVPQSAWRSNFKLGAFFPPISFEHRAPGWSNPYTISSSALNTWVGEELRTIGAAYELEHLGIASGGQWDFGAHAALYGWNDPAGVIVGYRGWAMHDRHTPLFGRIGTYAFGTRTQRVLFSEIDNKVGLHYGAYAKHDSGLELRALRYDNRADPAAIKPSIEDYAWRTRFNSLGLRYDAPHGTTLIAQWLLGDTAFGPGSHDIWTMKASFVMAAQSIGKHRVAARYDNFMTRQDRTVFFSKGWEQGKAWTVAWTWRFNDHAEIVTEWMEIDSRYNKRRAIGEAPAAEERSLQLALRLTL